MKYPDRIFGGDYSRDMWDAINSAKTKSELRQALYFVCCRLQELEAKIAAQQSQKDDPALGLVGIKFGLDMSASSGDPDLDTVAKTPQDFARQAESNEIERRLIRVVEEVSMLDKKIAELQLFAGRTRTYTEDQIEAIATKAALKVAHRVISNSA